MPLLKSVVLFIKENVNNWVYKWRHGWEKQEKKRKKKGAEVEVLIVAREVEKVSERVAWVKSDLAKGAEKVSLLDSLKENGSARGKK